MVFFKAYDSHCVPKPRPRASSKVGSQLGGIINDFSSLWLIYEIKRGRGQFVAHRKIDKFRIRVISVHNLTV